MNQYIYCIVILSALLRGNYGDDYCYVDSECHDKELYNSNRYLLYDVNPVEGFNLRRDVYMRFAVLAHKLQRSGDEHLRNFKLVLPPWSRLVHWSYSENPERLPWGTFFDLHSLKEFAPVMELYEFFDALNQTSPLLIDEVYILQHFEDMFETGIFEDKMQIEKCQKPYRTDYFFYENLTSNNVKCLSFHGSATKLDQLLLNTSAKVIMMHHAEVALHEMFGNKLYWKARRSMRFSEKLRAIARDFRKEFLNSTDKLDSTILPENWKDETPGRKARGGPYLSVHLRRRDFLRGRPNAVPALESVSSQIKKILEKLELKTVFIATDTSEEEFRLLHRKLSSNYHVVRYIPSKEVLSQYGDGGVAIIDQIICSHGRFFIGTQESTFSFRIHEEREIMGFPSDATFNSFCKDEKTCPQPSRWTIVY